MSFRERRIVILLQFQTVCINSVKSFRTISVNLSLLVLICFFERRLCCFVYSLSLSVMMNSKAFSRVINFLINKRQLNVLHQHPGHTIMLVSVKPHQNLRFCIIDNSTTSTISYLITKEHKI